MTILQCWICQGILLQNLVGFPVKFWSVSKTLLVNPIEVTNRFLQELNLDENFLDNLNKSLIDQLKNTTSVRKLTLKDNPWHCSCKSADLQKFLMQNYELKVCVHRLRFAYQKILTTDL